MYPPPKKFHNPIYTPFQIWQKPHGPSSPFDFQTVFIFVNNTTLNQLSKFIGLGFSACLYSSKTDCGDELCFDILDSLDFQHCFSRDSQSQQFKNWHLDMSRNLHLSWSRHSRPPSPKKLIKMYILRFQLKLFTFCNYFQ